MTWVGTYILDENGEPRPAETLEWAEWFETSAQARRVADTRLENGVRVSTIFLALDHNFTNFAAGWKFPPILWETRIFGGPHDESTWRYSSREAAVEGHAAAVEIASQEWNVGEMLKEAAQ